MDLLDNTPRQLFLQSLLGVPHPEYAHLPLVVEADGSKLSKSRSSQAISQTAPEEALRIALRLLRQPAPPSQLSTPPELHEWAARHWDPEALQGLRQVWLP